MTSDPQMFELPAAIHFSPTIIFFLMSGFSFLYSQPSRGFKGAVAAVLILLCFLLFVVVVSRSVLVRFSLCGGFLDSDAPEPFELNPCLKALGL